MLIVSIEASIGGVICPVANQATEAATSSSAISAPTAATFSVGGRSRIPMVEVSGRCWGLRCSGVDGNVIKGGDLEKLMSKKDGVEIVILDSGRLCEQGGNHGLEVGYEAFEDGHIERRCPDSVSRCL